jgi:hypothetical protein
MLVEPALRDRAAVRVRYSAGIGTELPQARAVESGHRIVDALSLSRPTVTLEQRRDLMLRLLPGDEPRFATMCPRERPQQRDGLVER